MVLTTKKTISKRVKGETYYYLKECNEIYGEYFIDTDEFASVDDFRYDMGNYFHSKEDAQKKQKQIETEIKLRRLINKINEEEGCPPDFPNWNNRSQNNRSQNKQSIYLDTRANKIRNEPNQIYKTKYSWEYCYRYFIDEAIKEIGKEALTEYFLGR